MISGYARVMSPNPEDDEHGRNPVTEETTEYPTGHSQAVENEANDPPA
jgi:hypothetical protein